MSVTGSKDNIAVSWRKRVDRKLNQLTSNYNDVSARLDTYVKSMEDNTKLTKGIDKKIDDLISRTAEAVEYATRVRWTTTIIKWVIKFATKTAVLLGQYGVALLVLLTAYWVYEKGGSWSKAFVNIFNGNLN